MSNGYIDSYYTRTLADPSTRPALQETVETDVCIIGGGLAGLATALGLLERGKKVVVLESNRIGWGASGRNGGFVLSGYAAGMQSLTRKLGLSHAQELYKLTKDAQALIRQRIKELDIPCNPVDGHLSVSWYDDEASVQKRASFYAENFNETVAFWPRKRVREACISRRYYDAVFFPERFHMHPLNYVQGIAKEIENKNGRIFEQSPAIKFNDGDIKTIHTQQGTIKAEHVVFCGSAYSNGLNKKLARSCLPVSTYVMVTDPIPENILKDTINVPYAINDNRWAEDYYRLLPDRRILWGGRVGLNTDPSPKRLEKEMLTDLLQVYPQLKNIAKPQMAWSGLMGYSTHKMPHIGRFKEGVWYCTHFGGNGLSPTTAGGEIIASAIAEGDERYKLFKPFGFGYTGGPLGPFVAQMVYRSWEIADKIKEAKLFKRQNQAIH